MVPPTVCRESRREKSVQDFHLIQLQFHGGLATEHGNHDADLILFGFDVFHNASEAGQGAIHDTNMVADVVAHDDLVLFHAHGKHLFLRQGDGLVGSTDKTGDAADIPHQMPGVTRDFTSLKHLRQWQKRNDIDGSLYCFAHREYLLNEKGEWEQFTVIGKQVVTIGELERLLLAMKQKGFNQYSREEYEELMSSYLKK